MAERGARVAEFHTVRTAMQRRLLFLRLSDENGISEEVIAPNGIVTNCFLLVGHCDQAVSPGFGRAKVSLNPDMAPICSPSFGFLDGSSRRYVLLGVKNQGRRLDTHLRCAVPGAVIEEAGGGETRKKLITADLRPARLGNLNHTAYRPACQSGAWLTGRPARCRTSLRRGESG